MKNSIVIISLVLLSACAVAGRGYASKSSDVVGVAESTTFSPSLIEDSQ